MDSTLARSESLSTSATRFGHPLNDNNVDISEGRKRARTTGIRKSSHGSDRRRTMVTHSNIDCRSSENRWIYGDSVGFSNVSNFEISKFYWLFFERSIFVGYEKFHFPLTFLFILFTSIAIYLSINFY